MAIFLRSDIKRKIFSLAFSGHSHSKASFTSTQENTFSLCMLLQQCRLYSRPRGALWRGRKGIGKEALHVVCDVKRVKNDSLRLGNTLQIKAARLLKTDLLAVLKELQRQHEVDLALKIFNMVRKEVWYKPDIYLYKDMLACLAKEKRVAECETLLKDLKTEGLPPDGLLLTEVMTVYLECGMLPQAMETFEAMRQGSCPPDLPAFKVLLRYLKKMGKRDLRAKIRRECLEFYEGIVEGGKHSNVRNEESNDEAVELQGYQSTKDEESNEEGVEMWSYQGAKGKGSDEEGENSCYNTDEEENDEESNEWSS